MNEVVYEILTDDLLDHKKHVLKIIKEICYPLLSLLIPLSLCYLLFKNNDFYPFASDGHTILMYDAAGQYIAYFRYFKMLLEQGDSFLYTLSKTLGGNFLSLYSYYLASPLNFLIIFVSDNQIPLFLLIISIVKITLASLTMYTMFRFMKKKASFSYLIFAISYGLSSYFFVYIFSPMWLDGAFILPLVVLGIHQLIRNENILVYPLSLSYALLSSWYIGFMICVFSVLYFFTDFLSIRNKKFPNTIVIYNKKIILRFFVLSLLGGLLAAPVWFSAFLHFTGTKAGGISISSDQGLAMNISSIISSFLTNGYISSSYITQYYGYMAVFTSIPALTLAIIYFFSQKYDLRIRISRFILIAFYIVCTAFTLTNTLLHGGSTPTWFPTRYAFIIAFLICLYGEEGFKGIDKTPLISYLVPIVIGVISWSLVTYLANSNGDTYSISIAGLISFILTILIAFLCSLCFKYHAKHASTIFRLSSVLILGLAGYSIYQGEDNVLKANINSEEYLSQSEYLEDERFQSDVDALRAYDNSLYRMENTFLRPHSFNEADNDPMFYGYNGISHFSSVEKKDVMSYLEKIGFHYNGYHEGYDGGSTVSMNSYLGIKYLIDDNKQNVIHFLPSLTKLNIPSNNDMSFYENPYTLPLAFTVMPSDYTYISEGYTKDDGEIYWYDHFEYQNEIFKNMTDKVVDANGDKKDIFKKITPNINLSSSLEATEKDGALYLTGDKGTITYTFTIPKEAENNNLYFMFKERDSDLRITFDWKYIEMMSYWHAGIRGFTGSVNSTHNIRVSIPFATDNYRLQAEIYYEDLDVLQEYINAIKEDTISDLKIQSSPSTYQITGKLNLINDNRYLLFTLPLEEGMSIYIDGKKMDTVKRFNIFSACDISSLTKGEHIITLNFVDYGLDIGVVLAALSLVGLVNYSIFFFIKRRRI